MKFRAFGILLAAVIGIGSAGFSYAAWVGAPSNPPSSNTLGPVWLQPGAPTSQVGNFRISGEGTSDRFIGTNTGDAIRSAGDIWMTNNSKAIKLQQAGNGTINMGNWDPSATGFSLGVYGNIDVAGFGGSNGTLAVTQICLKNDTCRTTWPTASAVSDIWVDVTGDTMTGDLIVPNHQVAAKTLWAGSNLQVQRPASTNVFRTGSWDGTYDNFMEFISDPAETQTLKFFTDAVGPNVGQNAMQIRLNNTAGPSWRAAYMDGSRSGNVDRSLTFIEQNGALSFTANTPGTGNQRIGGIIGYCPGGVTPCRGLDISAQNNGGTSQGAQFSNTAGNGVILADPNYAILANAGDATLTTGAFLNTAVSGKALQAVATNGALAKAGQFYGPFGYNGELGVLGAGVSGTGATAGVFNGQGTGIWAETNQNNSIAVRARALPSGSIGVYAEGNLIAGDFRPTGGAGSFGVRAYGGGTGFVSYGGTNGAYIEGTQNGLAAYTTDQCGGAGTCAAGIAGSALFGRGSSYGSVTYGNVYGAFGSESDTGAWGALGGNGYGVYSGTDIYSSGYRGVVLNAADSPLITRGWDAFTSGAYAGLGRWGVFMEPHTLILGIPNVGGKTIRFSRYEATSARTDLLTVDTGGNLTIIGNAYKPGGGSWLASSDERLKDVYGGFSAGLDGILKLDPVYYSYKAGNTRNLPDDQTYVGVVAQNVKSAIPDAVTVGEDGYLNVNNDPIIWAMVNSIKELKAENDELRARIEALEAK